METAKEEPTPTQEAQSPIPDPRPKLQHIDDFMREQDGLDAVKGGQNQAPALPNPTKKQRREVTEAEAEVFNPPAKKAIEELGGINWIGKLLEYRDAHPTSVDGLAYAEVVVGQAPARFRCTAVIQESSQQFGGSEISFLKKKDAKQYASMKAIEWLIENNYMPADGSVKFSKFPQPPPVPEGAQTKRTPSISYASQIPELCIRLGFNPPTYEIKKASEYAPLWNGFAHFGGDPRIEEKIGVVANVYGKSNAKEQIAKEVLSFLKDIERQRMETQDEEDKKRKGSSESSDISDDVAGKAAKVQF